MKVAAILLVCAIAHAKNIDLNDNGCPIDPTIEKLYPHEHCNKFYQCTHGELILHNCTSNLLFNVNIQECDWPENVDCGNRTIPEPGDDDNGNNNRTCNCNPQEAPSICAKDGSDGTLIAHENCNQFYKCFNGKPVAMSCPGTLLYDPYKEQCDWPENVECGDRIIPEPCDDDNGNNNRTCNCNPQEAPSICAKDGSDGTLIAHENCNQFYKCYSGNPVAMSCPGTLLYDPYKEQCDWPENVECGDRIIPEPCDDDNGNNNRTCNCNPQEAPSICAKDGSDGTLIAHENCNQFYKCFNGKPVAMSCPGTLLYDPYKEQCDWPENVECGDRIIPEPCDDDNGNNNRTCNCNPQEAPSICAKDGSDGTLIAHENCNQFYKCYSGKPVAMSCPGTLLYDPYKEQCDWPENVECGDRIIPEPCDDDNGNNNRTCNCNPQEAPSICAKDGSDGTLIAHENCNQFYKCYNGKPVAMLCPGRLLYNPYKEQCDWPENVECGDRIIPEPGDDDNGNNNRTCNCNPQEAPSICAKDGSDGTLIAHENCNQFYKCYSGKPVAMSCPGTLLYDPYKEQCDWPENVECGDRIIPEPGDDNNGSNNRTCNCNPQEAPSICAKDGSDGTLIAHENCNQFYKCFNGKPVAMSCPGTLLYDPYKEQCDWPENVECGDRIIPEPCDDDNGNNNGTCNCNPQEAPSICAKDGSDGTLIAHENCNQFYKCYSGKPVAMSCPGTLLYDPYKEQCDWPQNVECGDRIIPEPSDDDNGNNNRTCNCNPQEAPSICAKDGSDGTLIAHENCNQFYKCFNGKPVAMKCPGRLLYNPYKEQCDWPENVECGDRIIPEPGDDDNGNNNRTCNCNPQEAPSICAKDGSDGTLIAHENCNQFYKCYSGKPVAMSCPGTLLYDPYKEQCDWPQNVECGDRIIPEPSDDDNGNNNRTCNCNPQEAPSICAKDGSDGTLIAHENCNQFYKCYNGKPVAMKCPGRLLYNPYKEQCDWPENVECGDRIIPEPGDDDNGNNNRTCNCNPQEAPSICAKDGSDGTLIAHENCNQFYKCYNGKPVTMSCPGTLLYDPYKEQCDWPENVECGDRIIPEPGDDNNGNNNRTCNCNPQEAPSICAKDGSDGTLIAHENCNQFYKCFNGKPVAMSCPGTLLYDPYKEQCDWPENVECGDRIIPEPCDDDNGNNNRTCNCNPQEAPSICAKDGSDGTLIAHENCNQFYKCYSGKPVAMSCPGTLLYDPYKEQCDWPQNVECGDRIIPEPCDDDNGNNNRTCNCNPQEAPSICTKDGSDGTLIAHENCNQFYKCFNGKPVAMKCPGRLLYNPYKEQCDWPENVECGNRIIPEPGDDDNGNNNRTCNCNPQEAPSICAKDGSDGTLIAHENCNQFFKCYSGKPVAMSCPGTLLYDPYKEQCDWPQNVECGDRIIPEPCDDDNGNNNRTCNCNPQEAPSICAKDGSDGTLIAHENCNQFYKCYNGKPVAMLCPGRLLYNPYKEQCDWPENVECGDRIIPEPGDDDNGNNNRTCNCNPQEAPSICAKEGSDGTLIAHENCNQFYKCYSGKPVAMSCPGTLLYDPYKEQCDWPENVECGDRIIPEPGDDNNGNNNRTCNCNPQEAPSICAKDGSDGTLIAHENCNQFYKCFNGKPVAMSCPGILLYDPYKEQCDWPENVECGDRIIPEPCDDDNGNNNRTCNCNPQESPSICAKDGSDGTLIAHENCNQFYKCYSGKPVAMSCPGTLLYDPYKEQCDWPQNVECGDRIIPEPCDDDNGNNNRTCNCNPQEAPSICAKDGSDGTLIAHENCNQFYKCFNGKPVAMKCPGRLLYNPYKEQCDWPENVECGNRIIPEPGDDDNGNNNRTCNCNPQEAPSICAKDGSDGTLIAHENCNQFYKCYSGKPVAMSCPGTLLYDPYKEQCDWPQNVECGDRIIPEPCDDDNGNNNRTCNCNPQEAPSICAKDGSDGTLIAHENCNQFYKCFNGKPVAMKCPGRLLYNPYKEQCDWPENVECGDRIIPEPGDDDNGNNNRTCNCNPQEAPSICAKDGSDGTLIAHENCNQFYKCYSGKPVAMSCPGTLLYDPYKEQCDWPQNVECGDRIIPEPCDDDNGNNNRTCNCNPQEAPSICAKDGSDGTLIAHENCNQFYKCFNGKPVAMKCPGRLLYNPYKEQCDWPENVECGNRIIPEPGDDDNGNNNRTCNCNPQEAPSICAKDGSDGTLIAHENCNQFYKCYSGKPVAMSCPGTLLYDPYKEQCDWPQNVECGDRIIPEPCDDDNGNNNRTCNCNPQEAPSICAKDGSDGTLIAHENCNQFYKCFNGKPVAMKCPGRLLYNPYKEQCDWPENVECGDRIIPEPGDDDNGNNNRTCNCNPQEAPSICAKDGSDGTLIAHENCNQFYKCYSGKPVAMSCPGTLLYDPYKEQCDWPQNVECGDRIIPEPCDDDNGNNNRTCNCNPQEAPSICAKDGSDGTLIAHENCNQFYKCYNGKPVAMLCPGRLLYNPYKEQCDWPENVECGDRIIPEPGDDDNGNNNRTCNCNPQEAPSICAKDGSDGTLIAHENCNQFYKCYSGKPVAMSCPGTLLYDPYKEQCDWPQNVECGDRIIPEPCDDDNGNNNRTCNCNPQEAPSICAKDGSDGTLIAHENCNQFYKCFNGKPVAMSCPGTLLYDPYKEQCDWPENVECGDRIIPEPGDDDNGNNNRTCNCNPQEAPSICAKDGSDGTLIAHENCNQFYKCYSGKPVAMSCPGTLLYDPYKEQCDWPQNVECGDRIIPEPCDDDNGNNNRTCNCNPQEAPSICAKDGSDGTLIAHENCNQFYKCFNGKPVAMSCPGTLLYDPYKEQCDWPENVECGDRIIPEPCDDDNGNNNRTCNCNPQEAPSICAKDGSDGTLIAHENCNQFYKCYNAKPVAMLCPGKLLYNPYKEQCDWPDNVECDDRIIPEPYENENDNTSTENGGNSSETDNDNGNNNRTCNCNPQEAPSLCARDGTNGDLVAHENCNQFYKCFNGKPHPMRCPGNLLYNAYEKQCDWPEKVACGDRIIPEPSENENNSTENGGNSGESENDNNNDTCNCNPQEAPLICEKDQSNGELVAHENCNQFYQCFNKQPIPMRCPGILLYNPHKRQCDWPENVYCGDRVITPPSENDNSDSNEEDISTEIDINNNRTCNCDPNQAEAICSKDNSDDTLIAHETCNKFYVCNFGMPVAMKCGNNLLYNPYKEICDWPENVDCGNRVRPESDDDEGGCNCSPRQAPLICAREGSDSTVVAHENCNQYYLCSNGKPIAFTCFSSLLYNPYKQQCDWPENVNCGHRLRLNDDGFNRVAKTAF